MISAQIRLVKFTPKDPDLSAHQTHAYPIVVEAHGTNIDSEIFVYQIRGGVNGKDRFRCVASAHQMLELSTNPGAVISDTEGSPFYRRSSAEIICRSPEQVDQVWADIQKEVKILMKNFNLVLSTKAVKEAIITDSTAIEQDITMTPPSRIQISYHPAGVATLTGDVQGITQPDTSLAGWLPASSAPEWWIKPSNAFLFYNMAQDDELSKLWPPKTPFEGHQFTRNGLVLPYGVVYVFTKEAIWWLKFDPDTIPGYSRASGQVQDGNAPWNLDYVSSSNPGAVPVLLVLTLF